MSQTETEKSKETTRPVNSYRIKNGDKISVKFLYQNELNEPSIVVRPDGFVSLQLIEDIKVEGLTTTEIKTKLEKLYNESLINPVISVNVVEFVPASVFIGGQVAKPGKYNLRDADTIVQTIFLAGGFTRDANRRMILYARSTGERKWSVQQINALKLIDNSLSQQDL
ncbi:MAG: polysaccharide export protein, partial [Pyrinomonadaceae bacterium]|nr:polysaccharide export protein [Pyrinomonadaceae bacterium]